MFYWFYTVFLKKVYFLEVGLRSHAVKVIFKNNGTISKSNLIVDTGATTTLIDYKLAKYLDIDLREYKERITINTANGKITVKAYKIDSVQVGDKTLHSLKVLVSDLPTKQNVSGLLGLNFLNNFKVVFNFKKGYMTLG